jgi:phosphoserine phosphatase
MPTDPLPSWNEGPARTAILDLVSRVTAAGGPGHVAPAERIAVFDNDGTLWCEHPMPVQGVFLMDRVRELATRSPSLRDRQPFKAFLEHDLKTLHTLGKRGLAELMFATHAGMTDREFEAIVRTWFASARSPVFQRPFTECTYQPQLELLRFLRAHEFKTYIVTGGGIEFVRAFAEDAYGIAREQIIGSSAKLRYEVQDGRPVLVKAAELETFNDREAKPENIGSRIGRRPLFAFGNSDGDLAMLRYTRTSPGLRLALLLHHDDAEREAAYDREFAVSPLAEALDHADQYGIMLVSMKRDWSTVFRTDDAAQ